MNILMDANELCEFLWMKWQKNLRYLLDSINTNIVYMQQNRSIGSDANDLYDGCRHEIN